MFQEYEEIIRTTKKDTPREIFADALTDRAAGIIFVHNHPENDVEPSETDKKMTKQLCDAARLYNK